MTVELAVVAVILLGRNRTYRDSSMHWTLWLAETLIGSLELTLSPERSIVVVLETALVQCFAAFRTVAAEVVAILH